MAHSGFFIGGRTCKAAPRRQTTTDYDSRVGHMVVPGARQRDFALSRSADVYIIPPLPDVMVETFFYLEMRCSKFLVICQLAKNSTLPSEKSERILAALRISDSSAKSSFANC